MLLCRWIVNRGQTRHLWPNTQTEGGKNEKEEEEDKEAKEKEKERRKKNYDDEKESKMKNYSTPWKNETNISPVTIM